MKSLNDSAVFKSNPLVRYSGSNSLDKLGIFRISINFYNAYSKYLSFV